MDQQMGFISEMVNDRSERGRVIRQARLATMQSILELQEELQEIFDELVVCDDDDVERVSDLLQMVGTTAGVWVEDIACRFAGSEEDADELFAHACRLVDNSVNQPGGFTTGADPQLFSNLRRVAASLLARLWVTGFLLGSVPVNAWPSTQIATLILNALEYRADAIDLASDLDGKRRDGDRL